MTPAPDRSTSILDRWFGISNAGSTVTGEMAAGISTFSSLAYIFVLAPSLLVGNGHGMQFRLILIATLSALATIAGGLWARLPMVFAPGVEMLVYISLVVLPGSGLSWDEAMMSVVLSGAVMLLLLQLRFLHRLLDVVPRHLPNAIAIGMATLLVMQGCEIVGVANYNGGRFHLMHPVDNRWVWGVIGCVLVIALDFFNIPMPTLIAVLVVAILTRSNSPQAASVHFRHGIAGSVIELFHHPFSVDHMIVIAGASFCLLVMAILGSMSKVINLWDGRDLLSGEVENKRKDHVRKQRLMTIEGCMALLSGFCGITNVTLFVESGAGIRRGGRTGLTAVMTGLIMITAAIVLLPFIQYISLVSIVGALLYVSILFIPKPKLLKRLYMSEWVVVALMVAIIVVWMSLFWALVVAIVGFSFLKYRRTKGPGEADTTTSSHAAPNSDAVSTATPS